MNTTILVVDDDLAIRHMLTDVLTDAGHSVISAAHGESALQWLRVTSVLPAVVLLDLMMPVMDGPTTYQHLRVDPLLRDIPVLFLSAALDAERHLAKIGVSAYIAKPLDITVLLDIVRGLSAQSPREQTA